MILGRGKIDHRPKTGARRERHDRRREGRGHVFVHEYPSWRHAGLPRVEDHGVPDRPRRKGWIRVGEHDRRIAPAELQRGGKHAFGRSRRHPPTDGGRAGEHQMVEIGIRKQCGTGFAVVRGRLQHAGGKPRGLREFDESQLGSRRALAGLDDDAVAGHDGLKDLDPEQLDWIVPGGDDPDPAEWNASDPCGLPEHPPWTAREASVREQPSTMTCMPTGRSDQWHDLRDERFPVRLPDLFEDESLDPSPIRRDQSSESSGPCFSIGE